MLKKQKAVTVGCSFCLKIKLKEYNLKIYYGEVNK